VATRVSQLLVYGLADDYFDRYRDNIRAVKTESVAAAAARHIRPEEVQIVLTGDADVVGPELDALGLAAIEVVSPDA
jgi:predicted Zn-dependent peptidase